MLFAKSPLPVRFASSFHVWVQFRCLVLGLPDMQIVVHEVSKDASHVCFVWESINGTAGAGTFNRLRTLLLQENTFMRQIKITNVHLNSTIVSWAYKKNFFLNVFKPDYDFSITWLISANEPWTRVLGLTSCLSFVPRNHLPSWRIYGLPGHLRQIEL